MKLQFFTLIDIKENQFFIKIYSRDGENYAIEVISYSDWYFN